MLLGRIGYGEAVDFTVIGNPVNVASRLEALTKEKDVQLILSREVATQASWEPPVEMTTHVDVRGVAEPIEVIAVARGRDLPSAILAPTEAEKKSPRRGPRAFGVGVSAARSVLVAGDRDDRRQRARAPCTSCP